MNYPPLDMLNAYNNPVTNVTVLTQTSQYLYIYLCNVVNDPTVSPLGHICWLGHTPPLIANLRSPGENIVKLRD